MEAGHADVVEVNQGFVEMNAGNARQEWWRAVNVSDAYES